MKRRLRELELEVLRFRPDLEEEAVWESYMVKCPLDATLLDALLEVRRQSTSRLALRWSCRVGQCGACAVVVNGEPRLACQTQIEDYLAEIQVAPLANFPVIRDLVVDLVEFERSLGDVRPWTSSPAPLGESAEGRGVGDDCIGCGICHSVCPAVHGDSAFVGPAALAAGWRLWQAGGDAETPVRNGLLASQDGVWACTDCGACSEACPFGVDPARAAASLKPRLLLRGYWLARTTE